MFFPGWDWASFQQRLWLLFAFRKEALECALPKFHSIKRTDGLPNARQFSQELCNTFWRSLHVFSKPSVPLSPHLSTFQQALNSLPYVWVLPFPFCNFWWYFYKHPNRPPTALWSSVSCAISQHVSSSVELPVFKNIIKHHSSEHLTPGVWGVWFLPLEWTACFGKWKVGPVESYFSAGCESQTVTIPHLVKEKCLLWCILYVRVHCKSPRVR